ncbi:hypothetical protein OIU14_01385 [Thalassobacter stenotrophicus]|uniref:hypothetical protein n=1 Tax=Thalassobacter stenotrophicus TaxID=266809 RepID=UPI0022A944A2|nr:hypothetical protein [Thalassobacter stenotrophicus]UYP68432.1 hypothetical protein OIU14_01385 [Thalassobacter stenotrophicus]
MEVILTIALAFVVFLLVAVIVATKAARPRQGVRLTLDQKTGQYVLDQSDEGERR